MKHIKIFLKLVLVFLVCWLLAGCVSSKYIGRKQHLLDISTKKAGQICKQKLYIDRVEALAPFNQLNFLYRVSSTRYLIDYYNGFLISPAEQLDSIFDTRYGGLKGGLDSKNRLQIKLTELYADYRNRNKPRGVVALQFILMGSTDDNKNKVLLNKIFREIRPLQAKNTENLLKA